ncbi:MAG TPA: glycosyltransferase family 2 protein [Thermoleophilaceae bacterium]|nr:glycosyltransferase family 2 protein [Thermoleophilaceae bacterium]
MPGLPRICIVSASGQNVFFAEILEAFGDALRDHGAVVEQSVDCFPPAAEDLVCLYVPHEYHPLVQEPAHPTPVQLGRSVALCTEQPGTQWFELATDVAARAGGVVDINALGARELERRGIAVEHAPLGYVPSWDAWHGRETGERSIDLAFLGSHTDRRAGALARCAPVLRGRRAAINMVESVQPHIAGSGSFLSHDRKWRLLADTKAILNVHRTPLGYMEWHRIVGAALNGCVVLSEHSLGVEPFVPGEHYISASYDTLPEALEGLLSDTDLQRATRQAAYELLRERMPMSTAVDALLAAAERAARGPLRTSGVASVPGVPMPKPPPPRQPDWAAFATEVGDQLPVRMALKHLVVHTRNLERRIEKLASGDGEQPAEDVVERLGPDVDDVRVSVLLTVHNYADYVGQALHSVALSDLREIEVVAVDDASTDDSVDAIRTACAEVPWLPVTLVRRGRNGGLPAARNLALAHARADLLFVLDADNAVLPEGIGRLAQALDDDREAAFAYGIIEAFSTSGPVGVMNWLDWDPDRLRYGNYIDAMSMIRRSTLEAVGGYSTEPALYGWEDFALWCAIASNGLRGVRVPDFVARYRVSGHSMISLTNIDSSAAWATLLRKYPALA